MLKALSVLAMSLLVGGAALAEDFETIGCDWKKIDGDLPDVTLIKVTPNKKVWSATCNVPPAVEVCTGVAECREVEKTYFQKEFKGRVDNMIGKSLDESKIRVIERYVHCKAMDGKTCPTAMGCSKDERAIEVLDPKDIKINTNDDSRDMVEDKKTGIFKEKTY